MNGFEIDETAAVRFAANAAWDKLSRQTQLGPYGKAALAAWEAKDYMRATALVLVAQQVTDQAQYYVAGTWHDIGDSTVTEAEALVKMNAHLASMQTTLTRLNDSEPVSSLPTDDGGAELRRWDNAEQRWQVWPLTRSQTVALIGDLARSLAIQ